MSPCWLQAKESWEHLLPGGHSRSSRNTPPLVADPLPLSEQLSTIQAPPPSAKVSTGGGKGKEVQLLIKANQFEDALTIKDVVSKAKDAESKSKVDDTQSKVADPKKDPP